jgi:6-phosphogluconolactonase/glucosamine-6-phosphate isomerase/deaminase
MAKIVQLDKRTRHANSGGMPGKYPSEAISHGPASVLKAETITMLAKGGNKKDNMGLVVLGDYNPEIPASVVLIAPEIKEIQRDVRFFMDCDAAESIFQRLSA